MCDTSVRGLSQPDLFVSWVSFPVMFILPKNSLVFLNYMFAFYFIDFCFEKFLISLHFVCSFSSFLRKKKGFLLFVFVSFGFQFFFSTIYI